MKTSIDTPNKNLAKLSSAFSAIEGVFQTRFVDAPSVDAQSWQSTKAPQPMPEIRNASFTLDLLGEESLAVYQKVFRPSLPWADNHFVQERISGQPLNPGNTWRQWPYANSADKHRVESGEEDPPFDHSYAERYWPRYAGMTEGGRLSIDYASSETSPKEEHSGIRSSYGDLSTLIKLMRKDPYTRQAYLPIWFPEDLYGTTEEGRRVPCSLGYHFMIRENRLHCYYPMRSCDFIRHFRDDVYLTVRLQLILLQTLKQSTYEGGGEDQRKKIKILQNLKMGEFSMHMSSLHMFENDRANLVSKLTP